MPASVFETLREGLAAPLGGMGLAFSSSLFGLAGSLVLGFLDLQTSQAQNRFYTDLEDWLSTTVHDISAEPAVCRVRAAVGRHEGRDRAAARDRVRDRRQQGRDRRHGQSRRGDPGPRASHAHRTADDPRLGGFAGRAEPGNPQGAGTCCRGRRRKVNMALARSRRDRGVDYWPGFVDALSTLLLGIIFLLSIFCGRAVLSVAGRSPARIPRCSA